MKKACLDYRGIIEISGPDRFSFLQGIVTQDLSLLETQPAVYALRLNRMGKILGDAWIMNKGENTWWMDVENSARLAENLNAKKLRYKVNFAPLPNVHVYAAWEGQSDSVEHAFQDNRHSELGWRFYSEQQIEGTVPVSEYRLHTLNLGIPDGSLDFEIERSMPLPWGCEYAIGWDKGCYVGQEPVARSKYQGVIRQKLLPVEFIDSGVFQLNEEGKIIYEEKEVGRLVSRFEGRGLALVVADLDAQTVEISN